MLAFFFALQPLQGRNFNTFLHGLERISTRLRKKSMRDSFRCKNYVVFADRRERKDKLHMSCTLDRLASMPIETIYPNSSCEDPIEGVGLGKAGLEVGQQMHSGIIAMDCYFASKTSPQRFDKESPPAAINDSHLTNVWLKMPLIQKVCEDELLYR